MRAKAVLAAILSLPLIAGTAAPALAAEDAKTGPQVLTDAIAAMTRVASFHVTGHSTVAGMRTALNLSLSPTGGGGSIEENGATMQVVLTNKTTVYIKADEHSWEILTKDPSTAKTLANKWIQFATSTPGISSFVELTVSTTFMHFILPGSDVAGVTKLGMGHWDGRKAVVLTNVFNSQLYVSDTGTPYLLHLQSAVASDGWYNFTDFGDAPLPKAPISYVPA